MADDLPPPTQAAVVTVTTHPGKGMTLCEAFSENAVAFSLAILVTAGLFALLFVMVFHPAPDQNKDMMNVVLGAITSGWLTIMAFFYGSSATTAGRKKDDTTTTVATAPPNPGA